MPAANRYAFYPRDVMPARADLAGVTTVTSHPYSPPLALQPISCYYYVCDLSYFDVISFSHKPRPPQCSLASLARVPKVTLPLKILDPPLASAGTSYGPVSVSVSVTSRCSIEMVRRIELVFGV